MIEARESLTGSVSGTESLTGSVSGTETLSGVLNNGVYVVPENDPTVPEHVKAITKEDIAKWDKGKSYTAGENIDITDDGVISVLTSSNVEKDNTKPITSAAVYTEVGNINVLLQTI